MHAAVHLTSHVAHHHRHPIILFALLNRLFFTKLFWLVLSVVFACWCYCAVFFRTNTTNILSYHSQRKQKWHLLHSVNSTCNFFLSLFISLSLSLFSLSLCFVVIFFPFSSFFISKPPFLLLLIPHLLFSPHHHRNIMALYAYQLMTIIIE